MRIKYPISDQESNLLFVDDQGRLCLCPEKLGIPNLKPLSIDWSSGGVRYRAERYQHEMIVRAVMGKKSECQQVIDCTAGLGRDAFILASVGLPVVMLERSNIVAALLEDAIDRAMMNNAFQPIAERMQLIRGEAIDWLTSDEANQLMSRKATTVYCDPMFPAANKRAKVKKEMQIFQALFAERGEQFKSEYINDHTESESCGDLVHKEREQNSAIALVTAALSIANVTKVVVKRPLKSTPLVSSPTYTLKGKSVRFDVYGGLRPKKC